VMQPITKKKVLRRLQIIKGQLSGLERMIQSENYCIDIITQSTAIKEALSGVEDLLLEHHIKTHVAEQMSSGQSQKVVSEILKVHRLAKRK